MQGIVDCTGKAIKIGDYVKTPTGKVIQVQGGTVMADTMYNAAACEVVEKPKDHKPGEKEVSHFTDGKLGIAAHTDCVVWGS